VSDPAAASATVSCPQCGGAGPLPSGERLLACGFCGAALFVDRGGAVSHYRLPRLLDEAQATAALKRWMAGDDTVKELDSRSSIESMEATELPMWLFRVGAAGSETVYVEPAAPTPIPQLADLEVPAGRLEPWRPADGAPPGAVEATVPLATARAWLAERGVPEARESALVRVPLWRARYRFAGHGYTALVEGSTGQVLAGVFPEKAESPYILVAAAGLVLFGLVGLAIANPVMKLAAYAVTALPLALVAWWVTRRV